MPSHADRIRAGPSLLIASALLLACAAPSARRPAAEPAASPSTQVFFYPTSGQSPEQQDRDRYECHLWSVRQADFDPSVPHGSDTPRVTVQPVPAPPAGTLSGAVAGAVVGAVIGAPYHTGPGAAIGAAAGATLGAASDVGRERQAQRIEAGYRARAAASDTRLAQHADAYRRAMSACLEGRGYAVQ